MQMDINGLGTGEQMLTPVEWALFFGTWVVSEGAQAALPLLKYGERQVPARFEETRDQYRIHLKLQPRVSNHHCQRHSSCMYCHVGLCGT